MISHPHDPGPAPAANAGGPTLARQTGTIDTNYRGLKIRGLSPIEAGNVVAWLAGLHPIDDGWTVDVVKHLIVLRVLVARGVIDS